MANDRVFLRCKNCGAQKMLFAYWVVYIKMWDANDIAAWLDEHIEHHPRMYENDLGTDAGFELVTEAHVT